MAKAVSAVCQRTMKLTADGFPQTDNGVLDVLVTGDDGHVYHLYFNGSGWGTWEDLGQPVAGAAVK